MVVVKKLDHTQIITDAAHFVNAFCLERVDRRGLMKRFKELTGMSHSEWKEKMNKLETKLLNNDEIIHRLVDSLDGFYFIEYDEDDNVWTITRANLKTDDNLMIVKINEGTKRSVT